MEKLPYECGSCEFNGINPRQDQPQKGFETFYLCEQCNYEVLPEL